MIDYLDDHLTDDAIRAILKNTKRIALVGASAKPNRPSFGVMRFLLSRGYHVTPVNPALAGQQILGRNVVASLDEAGELDMVDLFRKSEAIEVPVADAIRLKAKTVWMQLGIFNTPAAKAAHAAGLNVVINRCPAIEMPRLGI